MADKRDIGRRRFVAATGTAVAAATLPIEALAADSQAAFKRSTRREVRHQLSAKTNLSRARIRKVVAAVQAQLPKVGELSYGQLRVGIELNTDGLTARVNTCQTHSCGGNYFKVPSEPGGCSSHTVCHTESCKNQSCTTHGCTTNSCETQSCGTHGCEPQGCDSHSCSENDSTSSEESFMGMSASNPSWKAVVQHIDKLRAAGEFEVVVDIAQPPATSSAPK